MAANYKFGRKWLNLSEKFSETMKVIGQYSRRSEENRKEELPY
jgi:hypothetical protein